MDAPHYPTLSLPHRSGTWNACLFAVAGRGRLATPFGLVCESVAAAAPLDLTPSLDLSKPPRLGASASALTPLIAAANMKRSAQGTGASPRACLSERAVHDAPAGGINKDTAAPQESSGTSDQGDQGKPGEPGHRNIGRGACRSALADGVNK